MLLFLVGLFAIAAVPAHAQAKFELVPGSFMVSMLDGEGNPETLAGSHPDRFRIDFALDAEGTTARDLIFDLPPGLAGDPGAVPECPRALFEAEEECPPESQLGEIELILPGGGEEEAPIFALEPREGELFAFASKAGVDTPFEMRLRPGDFGVTLAATDLPAQEVSEGHIELWGVPADHQEGTTIERKPFLTTPTRCGPIAFAFRTRSWEEGAPWLSEETTLDLDGCADLAFSAAFALRLDNPVADSPTGVAVELSTPGEEGEGERVESQIEDVVVEMPEGLTVSPGGAQGLLACGDAQLDVDTDAAAACPAASRVGTVTLESPVVREALSGAVYLGEERSGERFRLFVAVPSAGGTIKFVTTMRTNPRTGRITAALTDLPPLAIRRLVLRFDGGPDALLAAPLACGPATARAELTPYSGTPPVLSSASLAIGARLAGSQCPGPIPFAPRLSVRSSSPLAGRPSAFAVSLLRRDGEQLPRRFSLSLPAGLSAALGTVEKCPEVAIASGGCPAASRLGSVLAQIGSGPKPALLSGDAYLTGPYRRAPFGMALRLPASIGPFRFGAMTIRATAGIDAGSGRVSVATDPFPGVFEGIPVRFQAIDLSLDRPGLVRNPTSCRAASIEGSVEADGGATTAVGTPFPLSGCKRLRFRPGFDVSIDGRRGEAGTRRPTLRFVARLRRDDTAMRSLSVAFPPVLEFDLAGLGEICSRPDAGEGDCPPGARVGTARARTPLLDKPLRGGVYVVRPRGSGLPELWVDVAAAGIELSVSSRTSNQKGRLVTKLVGLPDMPLSSLSMQLGGGDDGIFRLASGLCREGRPRRLLAEVQARGQNGSRLDLRTPVGLKARC